MRGNTPSCRRAWFRKIRLSISNDDNDELKMQITDKGECYSQVSIDYRVS